MANETNNHDSRDELVELLVPYALGMLEAPEAARVKEALASDPSLRDEFQAIEATGAALLGSIPSVAAPASVRTRVFDAIGHAEHHSADAEAEAAPAPVVPIGRATGTRRSPFSRFALPAFSGLAVAACLVLAVVAVNLNGDLDDTRDELAKESSKVDTRFDENAPRPVSTSAELADASGALLKVAEDQYVLMLRDVPDPGLGKSWQVWTKDEQDQVRNVAQWTSDESTRYVLLNSADITEVMVSIENTTAALPTPGSPPVASVSI